MRGKRGRTGLPGVLRKGQAGRRPALPAKLESHRIGLRPPGLPCATCNKPATLAYAKPALADLWEVIPVCAECAMRLRNSQEET